MRFMLYGGALTAERFRACLRRLVKDARQKVVLLVAHLKGHHARKVEAWVASHAHAIALFYLPADAPDTIPTRPSATRCRRSCASGRSPRARTT